MSYDTQDTDLAAVFQAHGYEIVDCEIVSGEVVWKVEGEHCIEFARRFYNKNGDLNIFKKCMINRRNLVKTAKKITNKVTNASSRP